ncbi:Nicotinate-nucleotide--dimethylbenzimidazole phosphoribosyltransferase (anaerobic pathway of cobalamin biosynthesis, cobT) [Bradyrhizobium sp. ORS 278]|uniref:Nicotinate-nucleotide--dimethylbenzimidazole phosphoribosyltransferase n=1 Tax=Bradyrhizobium sp. (strain ORS 278) TaxID=114615 RepID=COBT_BRASO|nr:nicotinate-nucleotide--dimethylbenzimidazole phosphoribosyltransferase [Bradyrhizobium sp. ORS 278]A4YXK4.1 RecName: Full=Nicotinate-nucleotide--dimethylbenzimidazole phosphoribosyltransferase; Short=NN:DBI PRT; AltName: Full=N(1)-alpha-phosphoribosyltransferase [Bradyrhizobium sp. ORS 278]CAL78630.1 Nicotinate-nucleotide--dimethylbenzimidazole phosphoribosyltransferase (anaerobic pathway of cobalamin biosynthesis, cobT) [Bradyrhizobium sp. ORS 278]
MLPDWINSECPAPSGAHRESALARQAQLTKPLGALGRLEEVAVELAALQAAEKPAAERVPVVLFAGDHGIAAQGVSAYPPEVTVQMLHNFAGGGAAIAVLAHSLGCPLEVVDVGTLADGQMRGVVVDKPRRGTRDFSVEQALTPADVAFVSEAGLRAVARQADHAPDLVIFGEMGIGNTTSAAAIAAALLACAPADIVGSGTGLDAEGRARKAKVIEDALTRHGLTAATPVAEVLAAVGGLEIIAMAGAIVAAAQRSWPVLVDGFIVSVAALVATRLNPSCRPWLLFSHRSAERGHAVVLDALGARPLIDLDLRLGEASGAATALPILRLACALHNGMATFAEAAVSGREA